MTYRIRKIGTCVLSGLYIGSFAAGYLLGPVILPVIGLLSIGTVLGFNRLTELVGDDDHVA